MPASVNVRDLIVAEAARQGVPAVVALAVASRESKLTHFLPNGAVLRGRAGEVGIFQLEPATASALGVDPYDLNGNIQGGVAYLKQMFARFAGWGLAIAAYNCGTACVDRYLAGKASLPATTRSYVAYVGSVAGINNAALVATASTAPAPSASSAVSSPLVSPGYRSSTDSPPAEGAAASGAGLGVKLAAAAAVLGMFAWVALGE